MVSWLAPRSLRKQYKNIYHSIPSRSHNITEAKVTWRGNATSNGASQSSLGWTLQRRRATIENCPPPPPFAAGRTQKRASSVDWSSGPVSPSNHYRSKTALWIEHRWLLPGAGVTPVQLGWYPVTSNACKLQYSRLASASMSFPRETKCRVCYNYWVLI